MTRTERLFKLMQALRDLPAPATARQLADELSVSIRTIYRDIDSLRGLGAQIDGEAGFGFTLIEDATLPPLGFTPTEIEALVLGLREAEQIGDPDLSAAATQVLRKLQGRLPPSQAHRLRHATLTAHRFDRPAVPEIDVAALRHATWEETAVEFAYRDAQGAASHRRVDPLGIVYFDRASILVAWCHLRQDFRPFRLDRMADLRVTEQSFRPTRVPRLRQALAALQARPAPADPRTPPATG
ncbi:YafY family transcriptional regulator [Seohaeicola saemankumensis]|nr:YafY family protein [Seohaeicola saemankumensis]MCA0870584.1 YafY family transcriptional regulator [Seohaeicola saemankumensis]